MIQFHETLHIKWSKFCKLIIILKNDSLTDFLLLATTYRGNIKLNNRKLKTMFSNEAYFAQIGYDFAEIQLFKFKNYSW